MRLLRRQCAKPPRNKSYSAAAGQAQATLNGFTNGVNGATTPLQNSMPLQKRSARLSQRSHFFFLHLPQRLSFQGRL
jgi:hypothetical protein